MHQVGAACEWGAVEEAAGRHVPARVMPAWLGSHLPAPTSCRLPQPPFLPPEFCLSRPEGPSLLLPRTLLPLLVPFPAGEKGKPLPVKLPATSEGSLPPWGSHQLPPGAPHSWGLSTAVKFPFRAVPSGPPRLLYPSPDRPSPPVISGHMSLLWVCAHHSHSRPSSPLSARPSPLHPPRPHFDAASPGKTLGLESAGGGRRHRLLRAGRCQGGGGGPGGRPTASWVPPRPGPVCLSISREHPWPPVLSSALHAGHTWLSEDGKLLLACPPAAVFPRPQEAVFRQGTKASANFS